jgi:SAM-dependent methyltransferase
LPENTVDVAYSNQLMEHLHPDDALEQLRNLFHVLTPGGIYICITPNALTGPHDVSRYFDQVSTGFHLKEYTIGELKALFKEAGFSKVRAYIGARGFYLPFPVLPLVCCEKMLSLLTYAVRRPITHSPPFKALLNIRFIGVK